MTLKKYFTIVYLVFCTHQGGQAAELEDRLYETPSRLTALLDVFFEKAFPLYERIIDRSSYATRDSTEILMGDIEDLWCKHLGYDREEDDPETTTSCLMLDGLYGENADHFPQHLPRFMKVGCYGNLEHISLIDIAYFRHPIVWDSFRLHIMAGLLFHLNAHYPFIYMMHHKSTDAFQPLTDTPVGLYRKKNPTNSEQERLFNQFNVVSYEIGVGFTSIIHTIRFLDILRNNPCKEAALEKIQEIILSVRSQPHLDTHTLPIHSLSSDHYYSVFF